MIFPGNVFCDSMDELINQFGSEFEAVKPEPNSSVNTDYKLDQTAMGTLYTTKALSLIYSQNNELLTKYESMLQKYDEVIKQNKEIIRLLKIMAKQPK